MISYYELLGKIKEGEAPQKLRVHLTASTSKVYKREDDGDTFSHYEIENGYDEDDDYHFYLADCFLESSMFDKNIEILDEKKIPEKLTQFEAPFLKGDKPDIRFSLIIDQINEIIDYLKSKGE